MSESAHDLLVRGVAAAKAGDANEARFFLEWVLRTDASLAQCMTAWEWLSEVSRDPAEKRAYLENILARDPTHAVARRKLALLDGRLQAQDVIDPDRPPPAPMVASAGARRFVCPHCNGPLAYTPDGQHLACDHCGSVQTPAGEPLERADAAQPQDFVVAMATVRGHRAPVRTHTLHCRACGAAFILPPGALSLTCPYCASVYVIEEVESRDLIPPQGLVPFSVHRDEALRRLLHWLAVEGVEPDAPVAPPVGAYLPAWAFQIRGTSTSTLTWRSNPLPVQRSESGRPELSHETTLNREVEILVPATRRLPEELAAEVQDFSLNSLLPYDPAYLADWPAETYEIAPADASLEARQLALRGLQPSGIDDTLAQLLDGGAPTRRPNIAVQSFRLILLPLWLAHYESHEQRYCIVVNGQSGNVRGQKPRPAVGRWLDHLLGNR